MFQPCRDHATGRSEIAAVIHEATMPTLVRWTGGSSVRTVGGILRLVLPSGIVAPLGDYLVMTPHEVGYKVIPREQFIHTRDAFDDDGMPYPWWQGTHDVRHEIPGAVTGRFRASEPNLSHMPKAAYRVDIFTQEMGEGDQLLAKGSIVTEIPSPGERLFVTVDGVKYSAAVVTVQPSGDPRLYTAWVEDLVEDA